MHLRERKEIKDCRLREGEENEGTGGKQCLIWAVDSSVKILGVCTFSLKYKINIGISQGLSLKLMLKVL